MKQHTQLRTRLIPLMSALAFGILLVCWVLAIHPGLLFMSAAEKMQKPQMLFWGIGLAAGLTVVVYFAARYLYDLRVNMALRTQEVQARMRGTLASIDEFIVTFDHGDRITWAVGPWQEKLGIRPDRLIGKTVRAVLDDQTAAKAEEAHRQALAGQIAIFAWSLPGPRGEVIIETYATPLRDGEGQITGVVCAGRDITIRTHREAVAALVGEIQRRLLQSAPLEEILPFVCDELSRIFKCALVWIGWKEPQGTVQVQARAGLDSVLERIQIRWDDKIEAPSPSGMAVRTGLPQVGEISGEYPEDHWGRVLAEAGLRSYVAVPLITRGRIEGSIALYSARPGDLGQPVADDLADLASHIALLFMEARHHEQMRLQTAALESAANAVVITDHSGVIRWVNPAFTRLTGYEFAEAVGNQPRLLKSGMHDTFFYEQLWSTILGGMTWRAEVQNRRKDGTVHFAEQTITPVRDASGQITHFIAIMQDVSDRKHHEEQLRYLSTHDPLTDLPNRRALDEPAERAISRVQRGGRGAALIMLDVDDFKVINDTLGHMTGDQLLVDLARTLRTSIGPEDFLVRFGGDEFAVLTNDVGPADALALAERLRQGVEAVSFRAGEQVFGPTVSVGVVPIDGSMMPSDLLATADSAMYTAKDKGKNRSFLYSAERAQSGDVTEATRWVLRLKDALSREQFVLYFQPVVRLGSGVTEHVEALIRLSDGQGGVITPDRFLPAAERFHLMPGIDRWVVDQALGHLRRHKNLRIFVNLSGQSLSDDALLAYIEGQARAHNDAAQRLTFEITETAAVRDIKRAQQWMSRLNEMGCQFALDDFGTGFSSFAYLRSMPVHYVKIDGSFVRNLDSDATNRLLVQAMSNVAHGLGKSVVAEWVESQEIAGILRELGVEYGQGYGLGRPSADLPADWCE